MVNKAVIGEYKLIKVINVLAMCQKLKNLWHFLKCAISWKWLIVECKRMKIWDLRYYVLCYVRYFSCLILLSSVRGDSVHLQRMLLKYLLDCQRLIGPTLDQSGVICEVNYYPFASDLTWISDLLYKWWFAWTWCYVIIINQLNELNFLKKKLSGNGLSNYTVAEGDLL